MAKQQFISIPLDIFDLRVLQTELTQANEFILTVQNTLDSTNWRCCGRTITEPRGIDQPRLLRHLPSLSAQSICASAQSALVDRSVTTIQP